MDRRLLVLLVAGLVAGCGGGDGGSPAAETETRSTTATGPPEQQRSADEQEIADVAQQYLDGISERDYEAACETRTEKEQRDLARLAGSCEKAFEAIAREKPAVTTLFEDARIGDVRVQGRKATAEIVQPGQTEPADTLAAVREDGRWRLRDG